MGEAFLTRGWARFGPDPLIRTWADAARKAGRAAMRDPAFSMQHVCEGTWFVGLDALPNDPSGAIDGVPLAGAGLDRITKLTGPLPPLHRAQVSTVFPGYPRPRAGEGAGAFRYRQNRDAAHLDGLLPEGPERRRRIAEPHGFILGLPLTEASPDAAPLVVWEGSHQVLRDALRAALAPHDPATWDQIDVTDAYQAARRTVFDSCPRIELPARPGEALLLHRMALHGVAPWAQGASAPPEGRMIAYFRPLMPGGVVDWLGAP